MSKMPLRSALGTTDPGRSVSGQAEMAADRTRTSHLPAILAMVGAVVMLGAAIVWPVFGSLPVAVRYLRGERLILEPTRLRAAGLSTSKPIFVSTAIRNLTGRPVRLLGSSVRCTCVITQELPATIPPGCTFRLSLKVQALPEKPAVDEPIVIFTDHRDYPRLWVRVVGSSRG